MVAVSRQENLFKQKSQQLYTTAGSIRGLKSSDYKPLY